MTRSHEELGELSELLAPNGFEVIPYPVLRQEDIDDVESWRRLNVDSLAEGWLVVTSPRAPRALRRAAQRHGVWSEIRRLGAAAVGETSARACSEEGIRVELVGTSGGNALAELLLERCGGAGTVLYACGRDRTVGLERALLEGGVTVVSVVVYAMDETPQTELPVLPQGIPVAVLVTSPRAARRYAATLQGGFPGTVHYAIGETTATALQHVGIPARTLSRPDPAVIVEELCQKS